MKLKINKFLLSFYALVFAFSLVAQDENSSDESSINNDDYTNEPSVAQNYPNPSERSEEVNDSYQAHNLSEDDYGLLNDPSVAYDYPNAPDVTSTHRIPIGVYYDDGIWFKAGKLKLTIGGDLQIDARAFLRHSTEDSNFKIRRARLLIQGSWGDLFGFSIVPIFHTSVFNSNSSANLQFAFIETLKPEYARLRLGLFKEPFSLEALIPDLLYEFNERSLGTINFVHIDDIGIMLYGSIFRDRFEYGFGVFNGRGVFEENNSKKEFVGRIVLAPFLHNRGTLDRLYFGFSASISHQDENITDTTFRTGGGTFFWKWTGIDNQPVEWDDDRRRLGCDMEWYFGSMVLRGEYLYNNWGKVESGGHKAHFQTHSAYVEGAFILTGEKKERRQWVVPKQDFLDGWGAWELIGRYEFLSLDPKSLHKKLAIGTSYINGYVIGLNVYLNAFVALKVDFEHYEFKEKVHLDKHRIGGESVIITRLQGVF